MTDGTGHAREVSLHTVRPFRHHKCRSVFTKNFEFRHFGFRGFSSRRGSFVCIQFQPWPMTVAEFGKNLLYPQMATTHILFDCNIQSIINVVQKKLTTPTHTKIVQEWKNLNSNLKLLLFTGINKLPKENPLSNLNKTTHIFEILSLIKEILTPIILKKSCPMHY